MIGFHIDMNTAHFTRAYLEKWLKELAICGYDTIIWELEASIKWDACPECSSPEAFGKSEFKEILKLSVSLGFENIPLLQTLGHCEYVLKFEKFKKYAEKKDCIEQYCPKNPELILFLKNWMDEYIELFGDIRYFHIGADETEYLGVCDKCRSFVSENSVSQLYVEYINDICSHLISKNITPAIWADMILHYSEMIDKLSNKIVIFDWMYDIHRGDGRIWIWKEGKLFDGKTIPETTLEEFGEYIYPFGNEPGRDPETFYTADYLAHKGFTVVTCPASSGYGDTVFAPRHYYHLCNTYDSFQKGRASNLAGSVLTSWTVHLSLYEMQLSCIKLPSYLYSNPRNSISDYWQYFSEKMFGLKDSQNLMKALGLVSKACSFSSAPQLGYTKANLDVPNEYILNKLEELSRSNLLEESINFNKLRLDEYKRGLDALTDLKADAERGRDILEYWCLAAENLINRAEASIYLFQIKLKKTKGAENICFYEKGKILKKMSALKIKTHRAYSNAIKPLKLKQYLHWMYDSIEYALNKI